MPGKAKVQGGKGSPPSDGDAAEWAVASMAAGLAHLVPVREALKLYGGSIHTRLLASSTGALPRGRRGRSCLYRNIPYQRARPGAARASSGAALQGGGGSPAHGSSTAEVEKSEEVDKSESGERLVPKFLLCNVKAKGEGPSVGEGALLWGSGRIHGGWFGARIHGGGEREEESSWKALRKPPPPRIQLGFCPSPATATVCHYYGQEPGARPQRTQALNVSVPDSSPFLPARRAQALLSSTL